jgi:hypothetical protein
METIHYVSSSEGKECVFGYFVDEFPQWSFNQSCSKLFLDIPLSMSSCIIGQHGRGFLIQITHVISSTDPPLPRPITEHAIVSLFPKQKYGSFDVALWD